MDFRLTADQEALRDKARDFAQREVKDVALERDGYADPRQCLSWDLIRRMDELGLRTLNVPPEYGGPGVEDYLSACLVMEELAAADIGVAGVLVHNRKIVEYLTCAQLATPDQRDRFLPAFVADEVGLVAGAITEPGAGTDNLLPYNEPDGGHRLSAEDRGDHYVLNGTKQFISEGGAARLYFVYARTDPTVGLMEGTSVFLVPNDTPGFHSGHTHDKMGGRLSYNGELRFDNAVVPKENRLGPLHTGMKLMRQVAASYEYVLNAARSLGLARACYEAALAHTRTRVQVGKPLIEHALIADSLVDMYVGIESARTMTWRAAWAADHRDEAPDHVMLGKAASLAAQRMVVKVAISAQEMFGAYGIMRGALIEKLVRDALTALAFEGGQNPKRLQLAKLIAATG